MSGLGSLRTIISAAALLACAGCDFPGETSKGSPVAEASPSRAMAVVALSASNLEGGLFPGGVLVVNFRSGTISSCIRKCVAIGRIEEAVPSDTIVTSGVADDAFITLGATGKVIRCIVETDDSNKFKGGSCDVIGSA